MRIHTKEFKNQIKELGREIDSCITYYNNVISSEELLSVTPVTNGNILKSAMKILEFESYIQVPTNTIIKYEFGLKVNSNYEYIDYGNYIVYESEYNEDTKSYKYICYDAMLLTMKDYIELEIGTFPMTIREYLTNLCLECGLVFKNSTDIFPNYDKIIQSDLYANLGYTYRDILDELSQVTASTICIDNNDMVEVRYINNTDDVIDEEYLKDINVTFGKKYGPINSIVLSRSAESDNVYLRDEESVKNNGLCELKIVDNQIMNDNNRSDYLHDILNKLNGLEYYINDFTSTGILYYELCDRYNVRIGANNYSCILFNDETKITQGLVEDIYTEMPNESETDYSKSDKTDKKINQAYIIVDKQNQKIEALTSEVTENSEKVTGLEINVNSITTKVSNNETKIEDITKTTVTSSGGSDLHLTEAMESNALDYKIDGNSYQEVRSGKNKMLIPNTTSSTLNGITSSSANGVITLNGANSQDAATNVIKCSISDLISNNDTSYTLSYKIISGTKNVKLGISFKDINNNQLDYMQDVNPTDLSVTKMISADVLKNTSYLHLYVRTQEQMNNLQIKIQLEQGTTATSYEQYGASPSPDYPSEVEVVKSCNILPNNAITTTVNGITFTVNEDKSITINGTSTAKATIGLLEEERTLTKGNYLLSVSNTSIGGLTIGTKIDNSYYSTNTNKSIEITNDTATFYKWYIDIESGKTINNVTVYPMLQEGTTPKPYVPYKNIGVKTTGKNLFKTEYVKKSWGVAGDNLIVSKNVYNPTEIFMKVKANEIYNFSFENDNASSTYPVRCQVKESDVSGNSGTKIVDITISSKERQNTSFTPTTEYIKIELFRAIATNNDTTITNVQLEQGNVATSYEPYQENITYIDLQDNEICKYGDAKDNYNVATGILTKRIGKVVLDGNDGWYKSSIANIDRYGIDLNTLNITNFEGIQMVCNYFKYTTNQIVMKGTFKIINNHLYIDFAESGTSTLAEFITWLSENPVTVYYQLETPYEIQLVPTDIPLFEGINNVSLLSTLDTNTYIKYLRKTPLSDDYATNQQLNQTNENLANVDNKTSQNATEINNTNNKLNNDYYNKNQIDAMNTSTEQMITQIKNTVETNTSSTEYQISVLREQITNGITSVRTETGYTFDKDGLKIAKSDSEMNLLLDNDGMEVKRNETEVLTVRSDGVETENLKVRTYFTVGNNTRVEDYKNGTGFFFIGGAE